MRVLIEQYMTLGEVKYLMKRKLLVLGLVILSGCAPVHKRRVFERIPVGAPTRHIHVTARKYEFRPDVVRVEQGTHVILEIESLDVTHGFEIKRYGINVKIPARERRKVEFYAGEPGTYPFACSHFCGLGHSGMKGKLIVMPMRR